jgi:insulysin
MAEPRTLNELFDVQTTTDVFQHVSITNIRAFKASVQVSSGVNPVRPLEEIVEDFGNL